MRFSNATVATGENLVSLMALNNRNVIAVAGPHIGLLSHYSSAASFASDRQISRCHLEPLGLISSRTGATKHVYDAVEPASGNLQYFLDDFFVAGQSGRGLLEFYNFGSGRRANEMGSASFQLVNIRLNEGAVPHRTVHSRRNNELRAGTYTNARR